MTDALWTRLADLVPDALARPPAERAAFLDHACTTADGTRDDALHAEAVALVASSEVADTTGRLESPVDGLAGGVAEAEQMEGTAVPRRIGAWQVGGVLGEGGMGVVYRASRADGLFDRAVALKRLRPGLGSHLAGRFDAERRTLARLEHDGIARLYDGGVDAEGVPFLVMELVDGEPLTTYADRAGLDVAARVRLFVEVCRAVAYAHRHLVVHRDLKPSNVLVTPDGRPKLLDFGIAKLLDADGTDALLSVAAVMTPAYAAPEQILGQPLTTATDVYALGVVLHELLAGQRPYSLGTLTAAQAERAVCETVPPLPSATAPPERARALRGDLDTIVAKALDKVPERRYRDAADLADDLGRHLAGLPVEARPASAGYRAGRFARRHRAGVGLSAAFGALLVALTVLYGVRLTAARDRAERASIEARAEADRATAVSDFLEQILRAPNARWYVDATAKGPDTPIRAVLDEAAARVDRDFADRPDLLADLHHLLGDTYSALGLAGESRRHHTRTLALRESLYTPPDPRIAEALYYAAHSRRSDEGGERLRLFERAVAMQRARNEGNNFPFMAMDLGVEYRRVGRPAEATALAAEGIAFIEARFVPGADGVRYRDRMLAFLAQNRAMYLADTGDFAEASRSLVFSDSLVARLPRVAMNHGVWRAQMCAVGMVRLREQRLAEAEPPLLACAREASPRASASPFPRPAVADLMEDVYTREIAVPALVALYDAQGRAPEAARFRPEADRIAARLDSFRVAAAPPRRP